MALAILAVASLMILKHDTSSALQLERLRERTLATWVADNELARLRQSKNEPFGERTVRMGNRDWTVISSADPTLLADAGLGDLSSPNFEGVTVSVYYASDTARAQLLASLRGIRAK